MASQAIERTDEMKQQGYITVNDVFNDFKGLDRLTISGHTTESSGLFALLANLLGRHGEESLNAEARALVGKIRVALQQWPNKTDAGKACERPLLLKDIDDLAEMMGVRS